MSAKEKTVAKAGLAGFLGAVLAAFFVGIPLSYGLVTEADNWAVVSQSPGVNCAVAAGAVTVPFPSTGTTPGIGMEASLAPASSDITKSFVGNFAARQIHTVCFNMIGTGGQPSDSIRLQLRSGEYVWNRYGLNIAVDGGGTASNTVSFDLADGWTSNVAEQDKAALWELAMQNVESLNVVVVKKGIPAAQSYTVSGFALIDNMGSTSVSALEQALRAAFGVSTVAEVTAGQAAIDSNGDGMTDLVAILMENSPGYFEQNFKLNADVASGGITVTWPCVKGQSYMVYRSTNLMAGGGGFAQASGQLDADQTGYGSFTDVDIVDGVQYSYRVQRIGQ